MRDATSPRVDGSSETTAYRTVALAFGPAGLVFGVLISPNLISQAPHFVVWWTVLALLSTVAVPVTLFVLSFRGSARLLRRVSAVGAIGYILSIALLGPALGGYLLPNGGSPWLLGVATIGTTLAALAWRAGIAITAIAISCAGVAVDRVAAAGPALLVTGLQDALYTLMFSTVFAALALVATRSGALVDRAAATAKSETSMAAAARGQLQERSRINALVHDSVLATLLAAARLTNRPRERSVLAEQATRALRDLSILQSNGRATEPVSTLDFAWSMQAMATEIANQATFEYEVAPDEFLPPDVVEALSEAAMEALRNSINHAERPERPVNRSVYVNASARAVVVEILDDGVGFDVERIPSTRLGLAVSIRERMFGLPGGGARIAAGLGLGARVSLTWQATS